MAPEALARTGGDTADPFHATGFGMGPEKWLDVDGVRTRYFEGGAGPAMVLFHGGHYGSVDASSARIWDVNFAALATHFNVIAFDRLGQGYTDNPKSDAAYTMQASVDHAARFLKQLGKGPYHVVGHSHGGYVTTRLALEHPDLVRTAVCGSAVVLSPGFDKTHIIRSNMPTWSTRATVRACYERHSFNPRIITNQLVDEPAAVAGTEKFKTAAKKMAEGLDMKVYRPHLGAHRFETQRWLLERGMPCPTLLTWGFQDPTSHIDDAKMLLEIFMRKQDKSEGRFFNRAGHYVHREHPESYSRLLASFAASYP